MIPTHCKNVHTHSKIKVEELGRKFILCNPNSDSITVVKMDGCVVVNSLSADYVVRSPEVDIIVELKGVNVDHGIKQIMETARIWRAEVDKESPLAAVLVARQYPKISTNIQRATLAFAKQYNGPLHVVCSNNEYAAKKVMSFNGPL